MYQDALSMRDKRRQGEIELEHYLATTTEIEELTGLDFGLELFDSNPLIFFRDEEPKTYPIVQDEPAPFDIKEKLKQEKA